MMTPHEVTLPVRLTARLPQAWRHCCGHLNNGAYRDDDGDDGRFCAGCRSVARPSEVEGRYLLVEVAD